MTRSPTALLCAAALLATPTALLAQDGGALQPGLWRVTSRPTSVQVSDPAITPDVQATMDQALAGEEPEQEEVCVTATDIAAGAPDLFGPAGTSEAPVPATLSDGLLSASFATTGDKGQSVAMTLTGRYQSTSFEGTRTIRVTGTDQPVVVAMSVQGTRVGDCPPASN